MSSIVTIDLISLFLYSSANVLILTSATSYINLFLLSKVEFLSKSFISKSFILNVLAFDCVIIMFSKISNLKKTLIINLFIKSKFIK